MIRLLLAASVLALGGCPYRVSARLPVPFKRIAVMPLENRTPELLSGHELTRTLKEEIRRRTSASIGSGADTETVLTGTISKISREIISETSAGEVVSERINIEVRMALMENGAASGNFRVVGTSVYEKQGPVSRDLLIREALRDAARKTVDRLIHMEKTSDV